jgi:hypothetical protein
MLSAKSSQELELRWESPPRSLWNSKLLGYTIGYRYNIYCSVGDPDPQDPHVFVPPGSVFGSISQRYGSGSGSGSFHFSHKCVVRTEIMPAKKMLYKTLAIFFYFLD